MSFFDMVVLAIVNNTGRRIAVISEKSL